jgi:predicted nucleotidyltransferase
MQEKDKQLTLEFKKRIPREVADHVKRLIVYGSRATERAMEDSDLDMIVLVDEKTLGLEQALEDAAYDAMWMYDFKPIISLKVFEESRYRGALDKGYSFYRNVEKEGVAL